MNRSKLIAAAAVLAAALLVLAGCIQKDSSSSSEQATVGLSVDFSALLSQTAPSEPMFSATQIMTGSLLAHNVNTGADLTFDWSIYLDEVTLAAESNKTIILSPGDYEFSLLVSKGDQQYAGMAAAAIVDGQNTIAMTIHPIIGDVVTNVVVVARLADFQIHYLPGELSGYTTPQIGFILDGGAEQIFDLNLSDGHAQIPGNYINISQGAHTIQLKLYDGGAQIGRSEPSQESVSVVAGNNITMDLVALQGETVFSLAVDGGDATFLVNVPAEVVNEAGGTGDLETLFEVAGPENPLQSALLSLTPSGSDYAASVTFSGMYYGDVAMTLTFSEISSGELLGTCNVAAVTLTANPATVQCDLTLRRRAVIGGNLLATVGVNVMNADNEPVLGAYVYRDGNFVGLSGSGAFGTPGYLRLLMVTGTHTLDAEAGLSAGSATVTVDPLSITNVDLNLASTLTGTTLFYEDFSSNAQGWTLGPQWQIGPATASSGCDPYSGLQQDPALDASPTTDNGIAGVVIGGCTGTALHGYYFITSPVVDASGVTGTLTLSYYRWLNSDYLPYMNNVVQVFDGTNWQTIWESGSPPPITSSKWTLITHDITAYANAAMQVRIGYTILSTSVWSVSSWNLDEVAITSNP